MPSPHSETSCDILVVGAGIGGASAACALSRHADVLLIEAEDQPGYHTTGRSAAFFAESYGGPLVRPLTTASKAFFASPPAEFTDKALITPRGCLHVFGPDGRERAEKRLSDLHAAGLDRISVLSKDAVLARVPVLCAERVTGAVDDPECRDMDVAAIHQGYLRQLKRQSGRIFCNTRLMSMEKSGAHWQIVTSAGRIRARYVVNAAGAWADHVAQLAGAAPVGLSPMRRTIILFRPARVAVDDSWPVVIDFDERYYFKPETGRILASPADETPMRPCDVQPDELDIAITVDRLLTVTGFDVPRIENRWAGLRTFSPDRAPVIGPDPKIDGFIWCAGQGGFGIQTAPAVAALTAALTLGQPVPDWLMAAGVEPARYAPARLTG